MKKASVFVIGAACVCLCGLRLLGTSPYPGPSPERASAWTQIGPHGGHIRGLARNPKTPSELYAVSSWGQVFRSSNNGSIWTRRSPPPSMSWRKARSARGAMASTTSRPSSRASTAAPAATGERPGRTSAKGSPPYPSIRSPLIPPRASFTSERAGGESAVGVFSFDPATTA